MKTIKLLFLFLLGTLPMQAQESEDILNSVDYIPFVELGKQWHVFETSDPNSIYYFVRYEMYENVERNGKTYIQTSRFEDILCTIRKEGLFREENRRVYKYDETTGRDVMLYDFSLKEGDTFTYEFGFGQPTNCKVLKQGWLNNGPQIVSSSILTSADTLEFEYRRLHTWTIGRDNGVGGYDEFTTWVEGVGSLDNMFGSFASDGVKTYLAYVERKDNETSYQNEYLPFTFYNAYDWMRHIHGCNLPTGAEDNSEDDGHHKLTYELEGDRLHVYGNAFTQCGPNHYAIFYESKTDDPLVNKIEFVIKEVEPLADCMALHSTNFYVPGFNPNMNYIVVDNQGEEHLVINKTPQIAYRPMIEDGKVWKLGNTASISDSIVQIVDYYFFDGDTIVDGKNCKQMMCQRYVSPDHPDFDYMSQQPSLSKVGAWYEENQKVYVFNTTNNQFMLMYDFSVDADDTLMIGNNGPYVIGQKQTGGLKGFKGVYRDITELSDEGNYFCNIWLEGVGGIDGPTRNASPEDVDHVPEFLMSCSVGDEVIYLNDDYEDGASIDATGARKDRFDFVHIIKPRPKVPSKQEESDASIMAKAPSKESEEPIYGEYNELQLDINFNPLADAYMVSITNEAGKAVYEKAINAGSIVGLNIDISAYAKGRYTVTMENSLESFTGEFEVQTTGIEEVIDNNKVKASNTIFNLQGQRISSLQKGLNIVNGRKVVVK